MSEEKSAEENNTDQALIGFCCGFFPDELERDTQKIFVRKDKGRFKTKKGKSAVNNKPLVLRIYSDEAQAASVTVRMPSADVKEENESLLLFMVPGVEGMGSMFEPLCKKLNLRSLCVQPGHRNTRESVQDMADFLLPHIQINLSPCKPFNLLGYSYGGLVAMELALKLEERGWNGQLILVDSAPSYLKPLVRGFGGDDMNEFDINQLCYIFSLLAPQCANKKIIRKLEERMRAVDTFEERLVEFVGSLPPLGYSRKYLISILRCTYIRCLAVLDYEWTHSKTIKARPILIRQSGPAYRLEADYGLSKYFEKKVEIHYVGGSHFNLMDSNETAQVINNIILS